MPIAFGFISYLPFAYLLSLFGFKSPWLISLFFLKALLIEEAICKQQSHQEHHSFLEPSSSNASICSAHAGIGRFKAT